MSKNLSLPRSRQRQLRFDGDEVWTKLPPAGRQQCQTLLAQLLAAVVSGEREHAKDANDHERQD